MASKAAFAPFHRLDRAAVLVCTSIVVAVIVGGFAYDMATVSSPNPFTYSWYTHVHAVAFSAWLVLLATQVALVRTGRVALHRRVGRIGFYLVPVMLVTGPMVAILHRADLPYSAVWLPFMATQFTNVMASVVLLTAGLLLRRDVASHKRLMLMGTIAVTEPGFGRLIGDPLHAALGEGYLQYYVATYIGTLLLMLLAGAYDLRTRGRPHPAWTAAFLWTFANEALASWLVYQPFWLHWMARLTGH